MEKFPRLCAIVVAGNADFYNWIMLHVVDNSEDRIFDEVIVAVVGLVEEYLPVNTGTLRISVSKSSILVNVDWFDIRTYLVKFWINKIFLSIRFFSIENLDRI